MTTSPVVLVDVYTCKPILSPLPQDIQTHEVSATQAKIQATSQLPISTSSPPEAQSQSLPRVNLRQRVHLDSAPTHGPLRHPITKAPYLDHQTGVEPQILHPSRSGLVRHHCQLLANSPPHP